MEPLLPHVKLTGLVLFPPRHNPIIVHAHFSQMSRMSRCFTHAHLFKHCQIICPGQHALSTTLFGVTLTPVTQTFYKL